ncbi:MAG TPA: hypothetical protein VHV51_05780 [Polyangiaceae bacterium]|nr:hypothetical protein [Polyangiaceae bacterium]
MTSKKLFAIVLCGLALSLCMSGCGDRPVGPPVQPDCAAGNGYDLSKVILKASQLSPGTSPSTAGTGFDFGDTTPGAIRMWPALAVDGSDTCGDTQVLDIQNSGQNDYGASFFLLLVGGVDVSGSDGLFFWAKAPLRASTNSLTLLIGDKNNVDSGGGCVDATPPPDALITMTGTDQTNTSSSTPVAQSGVSASNTPNYQPPPGSCGNLFQYPFQFTAVWTLYLLPWNLFFQNQQPNRNPEGLDTSSLQEIGFQIPKEAHFEMWIDQIGAYKLESAAAGP